MLDGSVARSKSSSLVHAVRPNAAMMNTPRGDMRARSSTPVPLLDPPSRGIRRSPRCADCAAHCTRSARDAGNALSTVCTRTPSCRRPSAYADVRLPASWRGVYDSCLNQKLCYKSTIIMLASSRRDRLDETFVALGDPARLAIVKLLRERPCRSSEIASAL